VVLPHYLPARAAAEGASGSGGAPSFGGQLVALIEDDPDILFALSLLLRGWGLRTLEARSLGELDPALGTQSERPALLITDYYLPGGMTGRDAVRRLRSAAGTAVPAIVLTGDTSSERAQEAAAYNYGLLLKPVQPERLEQAIREALSAP